MPGPAPPSASYLIKIVDSSDEEDEEPEEDVMGSLKRVERDMADLVEPPTLTKPRSDSTASVASSTTSTSPPKKKKKKKNRNKNKKKKKNKAVVIDSDDDEETPTPSKSVSFDSVQVKSFERSLGTDVVPYDGGWPLGLGPALGDPESISVDTYETSKQERLRIRALEKGILKENPGEETVLETRQWDYKHRSKNPLFHLLQEEQRMDLLLEDSTPDEEDDLTVCSTHSNNSPKNSHSSPTKRNSGSSTGGSPTKRDSKGNNKMKKRDSKNKHNTVGPASNTRSRSGSFSQQERYNDAYTQMDVHRVRNELEQLRIQRTGEGHTGCECRKLDVYLLPPNAGKKAHHRRMKLLRVKEELRKRHMLPSDKSKTREELELLLHDAVEKEACCSSQDCPCARNGIGCQADVCGCWKDSHQTKEKGGKQSKGDVEVEEIQSRCGNANGMYAVDLTSIHTMRQQILKHMADGKVLTCRPVVSPHTPAPMDEGGVVDMVME